MGAALPKPGRPCRTFRVSQPVFSFWPEPRSWALWPATAQAGSGGAAGTRTQTSGLRPGPLPSSPRCLPADGARAGGRGVAAGSSPGRACLVAASISAAAVSPVSVAPRSHPSRRDQAAPHHLPQSAALLTNTRKHNLKVLRAGPKSTVSWERGHGRGTPGVLGVRRLVSNGLPHQGLASSPPPFVFGQRLGPFRWSDTLGNK